MTRVVRLTAAMVSGAKARGVSEVMLHDADVPGLALRVRQSGAKTWVLRRTVDGWQERRVLKLLGHRRTATTERYARLEDSFLIAAAERVSARIAAMLG